MESFRRSTWDPLIFRSADEHPWSQLQQCFCFAMWSQLDDKFWESGRGVFGWLSGDHIRFWSMEMGRRQGSRSWRVSFPSSTLAFQWLVLPVTGSTLDHLGCICVYMPATVLKNLHTFYYFISDTHSHTQNQTKTNKTHKNTNYGAVVICQGPRGNKEMLKLGEFTAALTSLCLTLLHFWLFSDWRYVATLCGARLLVSFFQQHVCLCITF